jgi:hypothetical protein
VARRFNAKKENKKQHNPIQTCLTALSQMVNCYLDIADSEKSSLVARGGMRLSPFGTSVTNWPSVSDPNDIWWMVSSWWNENWQMRPQYSEKTSPSSTLSTTNPTIPDLGSNAGRRGGKRTTDRLNYGTVLEIVWHTNMYLMGYKVVESVESHIPP